MHLNLKLSLDLIISSASRENYDTLPAGLYILGITDQGDLIYQAKDNLFDDLVHLPNTVYDKVVKEMDVFLKKETKDVYSDYGFLYKRSILLYGEAGTGKTCIVNRVINDVINAGGLVFFNPNPDYLVHVFTDLDDHEKEKERQIMVVFEEFDKLVEEYEDSLLNILDGEIQRDNIVYMATTNHYDKVPKRLLRPSRFSMSLEVLSPSAEARSYFLFQKLKEQDYPLIEEWVKKTEGFTIDELKETVLAVKCLGHKLEDVIERIKKLNEDKNTSKSIGLGGHKNDSPVETVTDSLYNIERELRNNVKKITRANRKITLPNQGKKYE